MKPKTLFEIIDFAKSGEKPPYEDCYYAMLVLVNLLNVAQVDLMRLAQKETGSKPFGANWIYAEAHRRYQRALSSPPKQFLGPDDDPASPDYQYRREIGLKLFDRIMKRVESNRETTDGS